ncbi:hypothetical protein BKA70DRAFT_1301255 [Coprinopsis sp. MPI-PUGE-AT-0042]|nr:hypothetical protein BKA70DRAFT_1301255 [Coprinopsis sp. MPI-PUGE-AT-0042]
MILSLQVAVEWLTAAPDAALCESPVISPHCLSEGVKEGRIWRLWPELWTGTLEEPHLSTTLKASTSPMGTLTLLAEISTTTTTTPTRLARTPSDFC